MYENPSGIILTIFFSKSGLLRIFNVENDKIIRCGITIKIVIPKGPGKYWKYHKSIPKVAANKLTKMDVNIAFFIPMKTGNVFLNTVLSA